ncbi:MAG TPA: hypothetical protein VNK70_02290 [Candidatus Paceibacterota bacterium]|nr:hypothetical protein [Candidatus Paceibacterota bacterium]
MTTLSGYGNKGGKSIAVSGALLVCPMKLFTVAVTTREILIINDSLWNAVWVIILLE